MEQLIKYIEGKLKAAKHFADEGDKDARYYAQTFSNQAFGALEYFCYVNWQNDPNVEQEAREIWEAKYKTEFDNLIFGAY